MKQIPSAPGYFADEHGSIWHGEMLKGVSEHRDGHLVLKVNTPEGRKTKFAHRLVCEAYHGPCPDGMECRHLDGNPQNNVPSNLKWGTRSENAADKVRHGTSMRGTGCPMAILTEWQVNEARMRRANGEKIAAIAREYDVNRFTLRNAISGVNWKHTTGSLNHRPVCGPARPHKRKHGKYITNTST